MVSALPANGAVAEILHADGTRSERACDILVGADGIEAIRMNPVGDSKMYNRDGFLTHTYLLRRRGDSSGCVVFEDYNRFLNAFKRGTVHTLIVVPSMRELPKYMAML